MIITEFEAIRAAIEASRLFDMAFYRASSGLDGIPDDKLLDHYIGVGEARGLSPNLLFEPAFYRKHNAFGRDCASLLHHYITQGDAAGYRPSILFDPHWFDATYRVDRTHSTLLGAYLAGRGTHDYSPNGLFDRVYYRRHSPDVASVDVDPFEHFITWGVFEGRQPSAHFNAAHVWSKYLQNDRSRNPFRLFLEYGEALGWSALPVESDHSIAREVRRSASRGPLFEEKPSLSSGIIQAKSLAFYLPQFHTIEENDRWWGKGFTEWHNIARGLPRFHGHYQPRIPRDLGFYHLDTTETFHRQIELAKNAGIFGFCFYYYNFNGHRLLERPLDAYVADSGITFPFCLMWANENWTRRWDGMDEDVLVAQDYRQEDEKALIADLAHYMKNERYIRLSGRPLLFLYRADSIPDCRETLANWRRRFKEEHDLQPLIIMSQTFGNTDPRPFGFDAAVEFPPHKFGSITSPINHELTILDADFRGDVRSYDDLVEASLQDFPKDYPLIKTVMPSWDNDSRKQGAGMTLHRSSPEKFQAWTEAIVHKTATNLVLGERILCINAWNEWCEGAYLEPDQHYGFAYLNAFSRAIAPSAMGLRRKILLVGHDAFPAGAQQLLLHLGRTLSSTFGFEISFVIMGEGALVRDYAKVAPTYAVNPHEDFWPALLAHLRTLRAADYTLALTNSTFSGNIVPLLADLGFRVCSLIHELQTIITKNYGTPHLTRLLQHAHHVVFPNDYVRDQITSVFGRSMGETHVRAQGLYKSMAIPRPEERAALRQALGIGPEAKIVLNVGYADLRKGVDLFVAIAQAVGRAMPDVVFVWLGDVDPAVETWFVSEIRGDPRSNIVFVPFSPQVSTFMVEADLFLLTSREDPFPSVVLEALSVGTPVAAFSTGNGFVDILKQQPALGFLIPPGNIEDAARRVIAGLGHAKLRDAASADMRRSLIRENYDFVDYAFDIADRLGPFHKISVIVPNYNYAAYIGSRIASICKQTYPIFELIVLDDNSTDLSIAEIEKMATSLGRDFTLIEYRENSGNVFAQWAEGVKMARGDLIWIAEADDLSDPGFLDQMSSFFDRKEVAIAFSDSRTIDKDGLQQADSYKPYYRTLFPDALAASAIFSGPEFLSRYLSVKNVILNASSVLWRRDALKNALSACADDLHRFRMAGDWRLYAEVCLMGGAVGYNALPLNVHRRHAIGVTQSLKRDQHFGEIAAMHELVRRRAGVPAQHEAQRLYLDEIAAQFGLQAPARR